LSAALITTHDGTVGYWDGMPLRSPAMIGASDVDLSYLSNGVRAKLLDSLVMPQFTVTGHDGEATLHANGSPLVRLTRPTRAVFEQQLPMVRAYGDLRGDRLTEILLQTEDLVSFYGAQGYLSTNRNRKTMAMLYTTLRAAVHVEMPIKHFCRSARPIDFAPMVQPMIQTPDHSSFPSGHAIEVFAASTVFARLVTGLGPKAAMTNTDEKGRMATLAFKLALRIASNRSVAGVHFPIDSASGAVIGCALGEALYRIACGDSNFPGLVEVGFDPIPESQEPFDLTLPWLKGQLPDDAPDTLTPATDTVFGKLWEEADTEWTEV
jgi:hypothetical protein